VVFGAGADANEGADLDGCSPDRIGTIASASLSSATLCP
jgi:hypothetical protein